MTDNIFVMEGTVVNFGKVRATDIKLSVEGKDWGPGEGPGAAISSTHMAPFTVPDLAPGAMLRADQL
jgi:hypothetical protein